MADVYDEIQGRRDADDAVRVLARMVKEGRALELGVGTGRVAIPLSATGAKVTGLDSSEAMLRRLRAKPGGRDVHLELGDMADFSTDHPYDLVYSVFGSHQCLTTQESQVRCFRSVAAALAEDGRFVVEAEVPDFTGFTHGQGVRVWLLEAERVMVSFVQHNRAAQLETTQHVLFEREDFQLLPVHVRYVWPSEMDLMARLAGLGLESRWGDWDGSPFTDKSERHISVYRLQSHAS